MYFRMFTSFRSMWFVELIVRSSYSFSLGMDFTAQRYESDKCGCGAVRLRRPKQPCLKASQWVIFSILKTSPERKGKYWFSYLSSPAYPLIRSLQNETFKCYSTLSCVCGELSASFGSSVWQSLLEKCWFAGGRCLNHLQPCFRDLLLNLHQGSLFSLLNARGLCSVSGLKSLTVCASVGKTEKLLLPHSNFYLLLCFPVFPTELLYNRMAAINFLACYVSEWKYCQYAVF